MSSQAYKQAGVNIEAGNDLVKRISPAASATKRPGTMDSIGGFGALFDLKAAGYNDPVLVSSTDGVGTKLKIAAIMNMHKTIGQDLVAMCVNDIVTLGAEPLFFLDYFATAHLDVDTAQDVITGIAKACEESGCALIGGETAEMPGLYAPGDYDLAGFSVGALERDSQITGADVKPGDVILGLASSGLHSNGFSLVRKIIQDNSGLTYNDPAPYTTGVNLGNDLLTPTKLYIKSLMKVLKDPALRPAIKGMANITGGGLLENIPRVLPSGIRAEIDCKGWTLPPLFKWLKDLAELSVEDTATTFNCGIGMAVICDPAEVAKIQDVLSEAGETVYRIGQITAADMMDASEIVLLNAEEAWA